MPSSISFWITGCCHHQPDGVKEMPPQGLWDTLVWSSEQKAFARFYYWKEGMFKKGEMTQLYVARVAVDIFNPANNAIVLLESAHHPFQKTVVYNKQEQLEGLVKTNIPKFNFNTGQIVNNYLVQGADEAGPAPIQNSNPFAAAEPNWDVMYDELHAGDNQ